MNTLVSNMSKPNLTFYEKNDLSFIRCRYKVVMMFTVMKSSRIILFFK